MNESDVKLILESSKENLLRWVKGWKSVSADKTILSALILEELGEWDSIVESMDDFCDHHNSNWGSTKIEFFRSYYVADFRELKTRIKNNSLSNRNHLNLVGDSLDRIAVSLIVWLLSSAVTALIVYIGTLNEAMGKKGLMVIQVIFAIVCVYAVVSIVWNLKNAANQLRRHK